MNPEQQPVSQQPMYVAPAARPIWKELLIPLAIVLAGACVGLGLYFGGGNIPAGANVVAAPTAQPEPADTTDQVAEVTADDHIKGNPDAPIIIVEYSDFDCPFCSRFHTAMDQIVQNNEDVAWVYRHFPLEQLHPQARAVAIASECVARDAGAAAFWTFTDGYFEARGNRDATPHGELIARLATEAGVNQAAFTTCFENQEPNADVQGDIDNAIATGGRGTPWSVIIGPTGKTYPLNGAQPAAVVQQLLQVVRDEA